MPGKRGACTPLAFSVSAQFASAPSVSSYSAVHLNMRRFYMEPLRTPDERFLHLPGYPFAPHYVEVEGVRIHYVDERPAGAAPLLLLHAHPSCSYLYRNT